MCFVVAVLGLVSGCLLFMKCDTPNIAGINTPYLNRLEASLSPRSLYLLPSVLPFFQKRGTNGKIRLKQIAFGTIEQPRAGIFYESAIYNAYKLIPCCSANFKLRTPTT